MRTHPPLSPEHGCFIAGPRGPRGCRLPARGQATAARQQCGAHLSRPALRRGMSADRLVGACRRAVGSAMTGGRRCDQFMGGQCWARHPIGRDTWQVPRVRGRGSELATFPPQRAGVRWEAVGESESRGGDHPHSAFRLRWKMSPGP
eukprot:gene17816-biopygen11114